MSRVQRRRFLVATCAIFAAQRYALAQLPEKIYRIGYLDLGSPATRADRVDYIRAGLRDLGYLEGKNIVIKVRWAEGKYERIPDLAQELVREPVDVLVTSGTPCAMAAKKATSTIPIVMVAVGDPIASGLVASLGRPAGNVTGLTIHEPELILKRLELIRETSPRAKQVAILVNPANPAFAAILEAAEAAAASLKMRLQKYESKDLDSIKSAFSAMSKKRSAAVLVPADTMFSSNYPVIAALSEIRRIPSFGNALFAAAGGLMGLGPNIGELYSRSATYLGKIFKGASPSELPVEQVSKFELVVNVKTAKALTIKVPQSILGRADRVIE